MKNIQYSYDKLLEEQEKKNKQLNNGTFVENKVTYDHQAQPGEKRSKYISRGNIPDDSSSNVMEAQKRVSNAIQQFGRRSKEAESAYESYKMSRADFEKKQADNLKNKVIRTI
jgi:hypothetical protein